MKTVFVLLTGFLLMGLNASAKGPNNNNAYFICHFNSGITSSEITELKQQGFEIVEKDSTSTVVYVTTFKPSANFTAELKRKMDKLIKVDEYGNRITVNTKAKYDSSPEFIKLFFNFI